MYIFQYQIDLEKVVYYLSIIHQPTTVSLVEWISGITMK